jgi:hypothetical protein
LAKQWGLPPGLPFRAGLGKKSPFGYVDFSSTRAYYENGTAKASGMGEALCLNFWSSVFEERSSAGGLTCTNVRIRNGSGELFLCIFAEPRDINGAKN